MMTRQLLLGLSLLVFCTCGIGQDASATLEQSVKEWSDVKERAQNTRTVRRLTGGKRYEELLSGLEKNYQDSGNLEALLVARKERERWSSEQTLTAKHSANATTDMRVIQEAFRKSLETLDLETARGIMAGASKCNKTLTALQTTETKAGNIETAIAAKDAIADLTADEAVTWARAILSGQAPTPTSSTMTKFFEGGHEDRVKAQATGLYDALGTKEYRQAMTYLDPEVLRGAGTEAIKPFIMAASTAVGALQAFGAKVVDHKVEFGDNKVSATSVPMIQSATGTKAGDPAHFIFIQGDWFIDVSNGGEKGAKHTVEAAEASIEDVKDRRGGDMRKLDARPNKQFKRPFDR